MFDTYDAFFDLPETMQIEWEKKVLVMDGRVCLELFFAFASYYIANEPTCQTFFSSKIHDLIIFYVF